MLFEWIIVLLPSIHRLEAQKTCNIIITGRKRLVEESGKSKLRVLVSISAVEVEIATGRTSAGERNLCGHFADFAEALVFLVLLVLALELLVEARFLEGRGCGLKDASRLS